MAQGATSTTCRDDPPVTACPQCRGRGTSRIYPLLLWGERLGLGLFVLAALGLICLAFVVEEDWMVSVEAVLVVAFLVVAVPVQWTKSSVYGESAGHAWMVSECERRHPRFVCAACGGRGLLPADARPSSE